MKIKSIVLDNDAQVTMKLQSFADNGWNMSMAFIKLVGYSGGPVTIYYDEKLESKPKPY